MRIYCKKTHAFGSIIPIVYHPFLPVKLMNRSDNSKSIEIEGLIDSGADCSVISSVYAKKLLDVDFKNGRVQKTSGISTQKIDVYYHEIDLEVLGMADSKCRILIGFMEGLKVGLLLGRKDFFDSFRITFDMINYAFEIETYSTIFALRN